MQPHSKGGGDGSMPPPKHPAQRIDASQAFNPPPSSIALVVQSYARNTEGLESLPGREVFQQLLQELFEEQNEGVTAADDVERNHVLIPVITLAGLCVVLRDDPFSSSEQRAELLLQASNSLTVINWIIQRTPQVLFCAPPQKNSQPEELFLGLWVLPRFFSLLCHLPAQSLHSQILSTIVAIFQAAGKFPEHLAHIRALISYFEVCFNGIIAVFRNREMIQLFLEKKFELDLPAETFNLEPPIWNGASPFDPQSVNVSVRDYESAAGLAVYIFTLFCRIWPLRTKSVLQSAADILPSLQQGLAEIWSALAIWDSVAPLAEQTHVVRLNILTAIDTALNSTQVGRPRLDGLEVFAARCVYDILQRSLAELSHPCERAITGILLNVLAIHDKNILVHEILREHLYPVAFGLLSGEQRWKVLTHDLQVALLRLCSAMAPDDASRETVQNVQDSMSVDGVLQCKDEVLNKTLQYLDLRSKFYKVEEPISDPNGEGSRKRRKVKHIEDVLSSHQRSLVKELYMKLGHQEATDLRGLSRVAADGFRKLTNGERAWVLETIGILGCAMAGGLQEECTRKGVEYDCYYCDSPAPKNVKRTPAYTPDSELLKVLTALQSTEEFKESRALRCQGLNAYKRLMNHTQDPEFQGLGKSQLGNWCLVCLDSSKRELRRAASRVLQAFVRPDVDEDLRIDNWQCLVQFLRTNLSDDPVKLETHICAWGQLGRYAQDLELNLVLFKMVEYLEKTSSYTLGIIMGELAEIAQAHGVSHRRLFSPLWRTISARVVSNIIAKPQVVTHLCEFVGMEVNEFLKATQSYTLPWMVLWRRGDVIARIAKAASKGGVTVEVLCHENMGSILALLFTQDSPDLEKMAKSLLVSACEKYHSVDIGELVRPDAMPIAAELLKLAGDAADRDPEFRKRVHNAIGLVAKIFSRKAQPRVKSADSLNYFFEQNVLGLCTLFAENLKEPIAKTSLLEKNKCLTAMKEMLIMAHGAVTSALPQICACLQSALEVEALRTNAVEAWAALMSAVEDHDLVALLSQTFSLVLQYWDGFSEAAQEITLQMIARLFSEKRKILKKHVDVIPEIDARDETLQQCEEQLSIWRNKADVPERLRQLAIRCSHENAAVVEHALVELRRYLRDHEDFIHSSATNEKPHPVLPDLIRRLLDAAMVFKGLEEPTKQSIERLTAECLGLIGAVDPDLVEAQREKKDIVVIHNFAKAEESCDFVMFFLDRIIVKAFLSATDTKAQGFLAWASQELLKFCDITPQEMARKNALDIARKPQQDRWNRLSTLSKDALGPFLSSKYVLQPIGEQKRPEYPIFKPGTTFREWILTFLHDMLSRAENPNARSIFSICMRIIKGQDASISTFLFPFAVVYTLSCGDREDREKVKTEFLAVLQYRGDENNAAEQEDIRNCCETIFSAIDYCTRWLREKKEYINSQRIRHARNQNKHFDEHAEDASDAEMARVDEIIRAVPPDLMGERSFQFKSYARALQYWETHIRNQGKRKTEAEMEPLYQQLQLIYSYIDEPDGIEGISAKIPNLNMEQQVLEHKKAGRWNAVQSWYELLLAEKPHDLDVQKNLLNALRDSGQNEPLLNQINAIMQFSPHSGSQLVPSAVEASWLAGNWQSLERYLLMASENVRNYDINLGRALHALGQQDMKMFQENLDIAREEVIGMMTETSTNSVRQCHDLLVKLHGLAELQEITGLLNTPGHKESTLKKYMESRLDVMGSYSRDKQYILALRRAVFALSGKSGALKENIVMSWLGTAQLARKGNQPKLAFNAVHHAMRLSNPLALIEHSKLLWQQGQEKNAIRNLEGALEKGILEFGSEDHPMDDSHDSHSSSMMSTSTISNENYRARPQNKRVAKARLLLAKWVDRSGRTHASEILDNYQEASAWYSRWEQGFYYLGRYYNNQFELEKKLPPDQQSNTYLYGSLAKNVCQNYVRAISFGQKYIFLTVPRMLTMWLDLGDLAAAADNSRSHGATMHSANLRKHRERAVNEIHKTQTKYLPHMAPWMFFIAFPQIMSRITHPHKDVFEQLMSIITKVLSAYPQQAIWSLVAVLNSTHKERANRGQQVVRKLQAAPISKKVSASGTKSDIDVRVLVRQATKLSEQLLRLANTEVSKNIVRASISKDLLFRHSCAPCDLVLPTQANLVASIPSSSDTQSRMLHTPFSPDQPTIQQFMDDCEVMNSLQKPRKITIRGSDGNIYHFLCKPKDDLRKDARLMEFNSMITRFLKKDPDTRKRSLYIRTYCVTALNEECGLIEWVNNVRTLRDIILKNYRVKHITVNYSQILEMLDDASKPGCTDIFTKKILPMFPPVFYEWFLVMFTEPAAWFEARLRYTRTSAVMSMVGTILGLGDRHGENILFDTKNGDTLHVDFNCLFDKGLTFDKPERVPFRLTQNMLDAMGSAGYEGVFRKACEGAMRLLRHNEETMMTVLEAFIHDPAVDMVGKKRANHHAKAPETPKEVMDLISRRLKGLWEDGTVPLSVEGQVDNLIRKATDPENLAKMYVGWSPMF